MKPHGQADLPDASLPGTVLLKHYRPSPIEVAAGQRLSRAAMEYIYLPKGLPLLGNAILCKPSCDQFPGFSL